MTDFESFIYNQKLPSGDTRMKTTNVFIAALPRSGSTLLGMILGANSQICHVGESAYWSKLNVSTTKCCCGTVGCKKLTKFSSSLSHFPDEIAAIHTACGVIDLNEEPNKIRHSLSLSAYISSSSCNFGSLIQKCCDGLGVVANVARNISGKNVIVENSKYICIAEALLSSCDHWKVLIVSRDPRGIASCNKEAGKRKGVPRLVKDKIDLYLTFAERTNLLVQQDKVLLVRYEDLCRNTIETLERVCNFVNVPFDVKLLQFKEHKGHLLMGNHMMYDANQEIVEDIDWQTKLNSEEKRLFEREDLVRAYAHLGYDLTKDS